MEHKERKPITVSGGETISTTAPCLVSAQDTAVFLDPECEDEVKTTQRTKRFRRSWVESQRGISSQLDKDTQTPAASFQKTSTTQESLETFTLRILRPTPMVFNIQEGRPKRSSKLPTHQSVVSPV